MVAEHVLPYTPPRLGIRSVGVSPEIVQKLESVADDESENQDRQLLELFDTAFEEHFGHTPEVTQPEHSRKVAAYINNFTHYVAAEHIKQTGGIAPDTGVEMALIPTASIERRLGWYYDEKFGYDRQAKGPVRLGEELEFLKRKNAVTGRIYHSNASGEIYRTDVFPQLRFAVDLEYLLRDRGDEVAADCAEVVLANHGDRILGMAVMAGQRAVRNRDPRRDTHNIIHWNEDDIPVDVRAEQPRYSK